MGGLTALRMLTEERQTTGIWWGSHSGIAGLDSRSSGRGVLCSGEQVSIDREGNTSVGMPQLSANENNVEPLSFQQGSEAVTKPAERESPSLRIPVRWTAVRASVTNLRGLEGTPRRT
jgi:hypothetical protein